jgi:hypothetical protein
MLRAQEQKWSTRILVSEGSKYTSKRQAPRLTFSLVFSESLLGALRGRRYTTTQPAAFLNLFFSELRCAPDDVLIFYIFTVPPYRRASSICISTAAVHGCELCVWWFLTPVSSSCGFTHGSTLRKTRISHLCGRWLCVLVTFGT